MEYMILIYREETDAPEPGTPEHGQMMAGWLAFNQQLIDSGHWVTGGGLQLSTSATTVRRSGGAVDTLLDGPYAETKEQLGGFYLVRADDLDAALELAKAVPLPDALVEVRPLTYRPDAG
ncbi:hypothetical protein GIS00_17605 [Nakamurella sp. YIM 132087]|uniref:YCII-related domain-containing protein n=1 Tax=Nakamurella alba TaxID=2665158 RepID=A0A7K1FR89_9ACTN|nr:YciI family protein [Nakamurella alba]MTD15753.1 hypothetical protein [Nakamurella alba]